MLVDFIDKKNQNQKRLIQELEAQNIKFVSKIYNTIYTAYL